MLIMVFHAGQNRYGLRSSEILEVAPMVNLRQIPHVPAQVAGVANYRGRVIPFVDLSILLAERPSRLVLSTRILVVKFARDGETFPLGLIAEYATDAIVCNEADFQQSPVTSEAAPYLGSVILDKEGMIQVLEVDKILPREIQQVLYPGKVTAEN